MGVSVNFNGYSIMKNYITFLLLISLSYVAIGQDSVLFKSKRYLSLYVSQLLLSEISIGYEFGMSDKVFAEMSVGYGLYTPLFVKEPVELFNTNNKSRVVLRIVSKYYLKSNIAKCKQKYLGVALTADQIWYNKQNVNLRNEFGGDDHYIL